MPHVAARVFKLTASPDFAIGELTRIVVTDQVISSKLLRMANSALFGGDTEITSLHHAIVRLGYRSITNFILSTSLSSTMGSKNFYGPDGQMLWDHSAGCAFCAKKLAESIDEDPEEAFLIGLLHDIGKLIYLGVSNEILKEYPSRFSNLGTMITSYMDEYHASMGGFIAKKWEFPNLIQLCIKNHHTYQNCGEDAKMTMLIHLSDKICNYSGFGLKTYETPPWEDETLGHLHMEEATVHELTENMPEIIGEIRKIFKQ